MAKPSPSIYYRYLVEREERDSDGNRSWRTVSDEQQGLDFTLQDQSGTANIKLGISTRYIEVNVRQKYQSRNGDYRYTEWRLESGETICCSVGLRNPNPPQSLLLSKETIYPSYRHSVRQRSAAAAAERHCSGCGVASLQ
ncbi:MAG: hypothetical protein ACI82A_001802 [Candidatus Azotimanducaceae bacterium]